MTMFTRPRVSPTDYHESTDWLRPSFGGYLSTVAQDAIHDFPTVAVADLNQLYGISAQSVGISMDYDETGFPVVSYSKQTPDIMDTEAQAQRIKEAGLEKELKPEAGYSGPMLDVIIERKRAELERKTTRAAAPDSWAPAGLAVGLGTSMLDPINIASAFLPIVPEARAMSLLDKAGTGLRRAAVRGGIGAVEGAGGAAVLEPLTAMTRNQEQADYGLADSLSNVAFGAVFGAALHPAAGAVGDWLRTKAGMRQNWEFAPSTSDTMGLKDSHAKDIFAAREAATPDADKVRLGQESQAAAALFDARARAWAYDMQRPASEYYEQWKPDYTARGAEDNALNQPAYHGSPYRFDKFTLDHIGTGEGNQAFGWGMYFAGKKSVAEFYRETLSKEKLNENPEIKLKLKAALQDVDYLGFDSFGQAVSAISTHSDWAKRWEVNTHEAENINAILREYRKAREGQLYKVDIPEDHQLLFWDKPLSDQPEGVRKALEEAYPEMNDDEWRGELGGDIYKSLARHVSPREISNDLNSLGIKGIKYLDGSSRSAGEGSHNYVIFDDATIDILQTYYQGNQNTPRAAVSFDADGKSVVQFFGSSDFSSAPHELYHVFRREMEQTAAHPDAPARVRESWDKMQEFVGAEPGMAWTREMEEKFAKAGERFLLEGKAPSPALQDVFERLRQWFLELYASADASGLDISDDMRGVFGNMLSTPMKDGDAAFRYALGSLMARSFAEDAETRLPKQPELDGKPLEVVQSLGDEAVKDLDAQWRQTQEAHPELKDTVGEAYRKDVSVAEAEAVDAARRKEILDEIALCETRH